MPNRTSLCAALGALLIAATWGFLVLARPASWDSLAAGGAPALFTLAGYVGGTLLIVAAALPTIPARALPIIPVGLVLNIAVGQVVGFTGLPLYLDAVGTVLIAVLMGPLVGAATGGLSSVVWGLMNPAALPFAAVSAAIGALAGWAARLGAFDKVWRALLAGAVTGIVGGVLAAPVAAFVYGGTAGVGTGAVVAALSAMGHSLLASVTMQSMISDPLDKALVFLLVLAVLRALPERVRRGIRGTSE